MTTEQQPLVKHHILRCGERLIAAKGFVGVGLAEILAAAGVPTEVRVWPGQIHDFQMAAPLIPEATRSLRQIGEYIREATG